MVEPGVVLHKHVAERVDLALADHRGMVEQVPTLRGVARAVEAQERHAGMQALMLAGMKLSS